VVLVAVIIAAFTDVRSFKIYNALTLPLLASGLVYHGMVGGSGSLLLSVLGMLFGFFIPFLLFLAGGMGGGDVKLMAGVGAWLGLPMTYYVFVGASLAAGLYALALMVAHKRVGETWVNLKILWYRVVAVGRHLGAEDTVETEVRRDDRRQRLVPFAAMVAVGLVATLVWLLLLTPDTAVIRR
jgi:prepilin peptidase CpaA